MKSFRLIFLVIPALLCSCTLVDLRKEVSYDYLANPITEELVSQIVLDKTTQAWVEDSIGSPTRKTKTSDGSIVYTYNVVEHRKGYTHILFIFRHRTDEVIPRFLTVSFNKGVVTGLNSDFLSVSESNDKTSSTIAYAAPQPTVVNTVEPKTVEPKTEAVAPIVIVTPATTNTATTIKATTIKATTTTASTTPTSNSVVADTPVPSPSRAITPSPLPTDEPVVIDQSDSPEKPTTELPQ